MFYRDDNYTTLSGNYWFAWTAKKPAENITIENCYFGQGEGVGIGSEMSGGVKNLTIRNCIFNGTARGVA